MALHHKRFAAYALHNLLERDTHHLVAHFFILQIIYVGIIGHRLHIYNIIRWQTERTVAGGTYKMAQTYVLVGSVVSLLNILFILFGNVFLPFLKQGIDNAHLVETITKVPVAVAHVCSDI